MPLQDDFVDVLFLENRGIFEGFVPFKLIEKYFSSDCISPDNFILSINCCKAHRTLCLNLKEVNNEMLFSSAILLKLNPSNKLSIMLLQISNGNLL